MSVSSISNRYAVLSSMMPVEQKAHPLGQMAFDQIVHSRPVPMENDDDLVRSEQAFAAEVTQKIDALNFSDTTLRALVEAITRFDWNNSPILQDPNLPYMALEALRRGLLDSKQVATICNFQVNFWSTKQHVSGAQIETHRVWDASAMTWIKETLKTPNEPFLAGKKWDDFCENLRKLPASEHHFLLVPDLENEGKPTISSNIMRDGVHVFNRVVINGKKMRMIPSMGMMQAFLDAQFADPVQITPRIYLSTLMQIRECGTSHTRDMMILFPDSSGQSRCPKKADGYDAPGFDFPYHDFYHAILASAMGTFYRKISIAIADSIEHFSRIIGVSFNKLDIRFIDMDFVKFQHFAQTTNTTPSRVFWSEIQQTCEKKNIPVSTVVVAAAYHGEFTVVQELIQNNVTLSADERGIVALKAAKKGRFDIVQKLVENNAPIPTAERGKIVIQAAKSGHLKMVQELLKNDEPLYKEDLRAALVAAGANGHDTIVQELHKINAAIEERERERAFSEIGIFYREISMAIADSINHYSNITGVSFNKLDIRFIDMDIEKFLHSQQPTSTTPSRLFWSEIQQACDKNNIPVSTVVVAAAYHGEFTAVQELIQNNVTLSADECGMVALKAAKKGRFDIAQKLVENNVPIPTAERGKIVIEAAKSGHLKIVQELLKNDAPIYKEDRGAALIEASAKGHDAIVQELLQNNAVIDERERGRSFVEAAENGHVSILHMLKSGAIPEFYELQAVQEAVASGHLPVLELLHDTVKKIAQKPKQLNNLLTQATENGHTQVAEWIKSIPTTG